MNVRSSYNLRDIRNQINRQTVKRLVPAWSYSMISNHGEESRALIKDGVMYVTSHDKTVAVDALTGKEIRKTLIEYAPEGQELSAAASSTAAPRAKPNLDLAHPLHQSTSGGQSSL